MPILADITVKVDRCTDGIYLRWYHSQGGWHYYNIQSNVEESVQVTNKDLLTTSDFSKISKAQQLTGKDIKPTYTCGLIGLTATEKDAIKGMLDCETVQWYRNGTWQDIDVNRQSFQIKQAKGIAYNIEFTFEFENYLEDV